MKIMLVGPNGTAQVADKIQKSVNFCRDSFEKNTWRWRCDSAATNKPYELVFTFDNEADGETFQNKMLPTKKEE